MDSPEKKKLEIYGNKQHELHPSHPKNDQLNKQYFNSSENYDIIKDENTMSSLFISSIEDEKLYNNDRLIIDKNKSDVNSFTFGLNEFDSSNLAQNYSKSHHWNKDINGSVKDYDLRMDSKRSISWPLLSIPSASSLIENNLIYKLT